MEICMAFLGMALFLVIGLVGAYYFNFSLVLIANVALWSYFFYEMKRSKKPSRLSGAGGLDMIVFILLLLFTLLSMGFSLYLNWSKIEVSFSTFWSTIGQLLLRQ